MLSLFSSLFFSSHSHYSISLSFPSLLSFLFSSHLFFSIHSYSFVYFYQFHSTLNAQLFCYSIFPFPRISLSYQGSLFEFLFILSYLFLAKVCLFSFRFNFMLISFILFHFILFLFFFRIFILTFIFIIISSHFDLSK